MINFWEERIRFEKKKNQQYAPAGVPSGGTTLSAMRTPSNVYSPSSDAFGPAKTYS
jgi:hypothetical protein